MDIARLLQISGHISSIIPITVLMLDSEDDRTFVTDIFMKYQRTMYYIAYDYFGKDDMDIDEAIGVTIERICKYCSTIKMIPQHQMRKYIVSVTGNVCRDILRKRERWGKIIDNTIDQKTLEEIPSGYDLEKTVFDMASAAELMNAFDTLPSKEKELIRMKYIDKMPIKQMAKDLQLKEGAVRTAISRARQRLLKNIKERAKEDEN